VRDLLQGAEWFCAHGDAPVSGGDQPGSGARWLPAQVPGTAAGAITDSGDEVALLRDYDRQSWWFRCRFTADPGDEGAHLLRLGGLATLADVWLNGEHVLHSENMFIAHEVLVDRLRHQNELLIRFAPLAEHLASRRPRPRWRTVRITHQNLRWVRTTLLGRMSGRVATAAAVGPWRAVSLVPAGDVRVRRRLLRATPDGSGTGHVLVDLEVLGARTGTRGEIRIAGVTEPVVLTDEDGSTVVRADVAVPDIALWWPHTHGPQPLYDVTLVLSGTVHHLGRVGFRTIEVDRADGGFTFVVNGVRVFARGTNWMPLDPDRLNVDEGRLRANVELLRDGNHNLVRVPGHTVYESEAFLDLLDEYGILLWQDAMFAFVDVPDDPELVASATTELRQVMGQLQGRPCLALVCGGADTEEQAAYQGVALDELSSPMATRVIPGLVEELLPGTGYLAATPGDSALPTVVNQGVAHYFGIGPYLGSTSEVRSAGVRFSAESLPFAVPSTTVPPGTETRLQRGLGPLPDPRHAVHRDHARSLWDVEDTTDHYTARLFDIDVLRMRQEEPERLELLTSATGVELYERTLSEWRRPGSTCAGALTLYGHDSRLGRGIGLVDVLDRPKATWYAMRRVSQPVAVLVTDEGFSGLDVHVVNDRVAAIRGEIRVDLYRGGELLMETATVPVEVPPRGGTTIATSALFGSFRDLTWRHRFGPPAADVVAVSLVDEDGVALDRTVFLPGGVQRPVEADLGLAGRIERSGEGWSAVVETDRFAQWVSFDVPGWWAEDSWFHLVPGVVRRIGLRALDVHASTPPRGRLLAVNGARSPLLRGPIAQT
jgi:beta-mannosidase